jgi:hypothetical protein
MYLETSKLSNNIEISYFVSYLGKEKLMNETNVTQDSLKIYIDKALKLKFKALCALQDKDMSAIAAGLIEDWVKHNEISSQQQKDT